MVTTGGIRRAKLQSNHHHRQTASFLQAGCPACRPTNSVRVLKGESVTFHGFAHPKLTWVLSSCSMTTTPLVTLGIGCQASCQPSDVSTPGKTQVQKSHKAQSNNQVINPPKNTPVQYVSRYYTFSCLFILLEITPGKAR